MLRITVSTFLLIFWSIHTDGQEALIATLKAQIDTCQTPLLKSDLSLGITRLYMLMGLSDEATIYCENALRLARQEGDLEEEANAMAFKMMIERERGHPFISVSQQALELARASKSKDAVAFVSYIIAEQGIHDYKNNIRTLTEILEAGGKEISLKNRGNILKALGGLYEWTGQFQEAETYYLRAEEIFKTIRDHIIIDPKLGVESAQLIDRGMYNYDQCLIYRALLYNKMGRFADAISIGNKALENSRTVDESEVAYTSAILGDIYIATGDMDKAIPLYQAAMDFYQIRDDGVRMGQTYLRFANLFQLSKDYEQAIIYLRKSIDLFNQSSQNLADTYQKLANVLLTTGQKESGMNSLIKADSLYALMNDSINQIRCQLGLAGIQAEQGKSELATMRIQDYLPMITSVKDYHLLFTAYFQLATINRINSDPSISIQYAHKALEIATERGNDKIIFEKVYKLLSDLEAQRGNFEQAYLYQKQFHLY
ncbi:MAG: tetratricopeptide repeat protein [Saprospiraceae bacterium]|nr:tetratricopeptide repeat protein [Saprospiraceae bacterium]